MQDENSNTNPTSAPSQSAGAQTSVSDRKLAANRENAKKSTGPQTERGKTRSSKNAYKHGFFAKPLYPTSAQVTQDRSDYDDLIGGLREHYQPLGYLENVLVEKIAAAYIRSARLLRHEQRILEFRHPFELRSAASLPRYQTTVERQLAKDIERLESLQAQRKAQAGSGEREVEREVDFDPAGEESGETKPPSSVVADTEDSALA